MSSTRPSVHRSGAGRRVDGSTLAALVALLALAAAAWAALLLPELAATGDAMPGMDVSMPRDLGHANTSAILAGVGSAASFVGAWVVMMTAMMLPSVSPMVTLHHRMSGGSSRARLVATSALVIGYLTVWAAFGVAVYVLQQVAGAAAATVGVPPSAGPYIVAATFAVAGAYQFSSLKDRCLGQCRSPFSFLFTRWRGGAAGGMRLGVEHGVYCVGCCWALMLVLVVAGGMGLAWVALIALLVFAEKVLPRGETTGRAVGLALLAVAAVLVVQPAIAHRLPM